jgi:hypothetical protein
VAALALPLRCIKRTIEILRFDNPHVDGMLLSYVADARVG